MLAADAAINKSVVAEDTAGELPQSAKKSLPCLIAKKLKYQVPISPAIESKRYTIEREFQFLVINIL